jgi:hypothetical protein
MMPSERLAGGEQVAELAQRKIVCPHPWTASHHRPAPSPHLRRSLANPPRMPTNCRTRGQLLGASKVSIVQSAAPLRSILASLVISGTPRLSARAT